ncbi:MAG: carbohydrate binding domain-containing protein [Fibrobacterales bacterium]
MRNLKNLCLKTIGLSLLVATATINAGDLIKNGKFIYGESNWTTIETKGDITFPSGMAKLVPDYGGKNIKMQLYQAVKVVAGTTYSYSFKVKSPDNNYQLPFVVEKNGTPWTTHFTKEFRLTSSDWIKYSGTFTAKTSEVVKIGFMKSYTDATIYIDDVSVKKIKKPLALFLPKSTGAPCDENQAGRIKYYEDGGRGGYYGHVVVICLQYGDYTWKWRKLELEN